jgi:hypothetical protein
MRTIDIGRGYIAMVDDEDYDLVSKLPWHPHVQGNLVYAVRSLWRVNTLMHRLLLPDAGEHIDHIDGNGLNNCRSNLRSCSPSQNIRNSRKIKIGTSKFKGVHFYKKYQSWQSYIHTPERLFLGYFRTEIEAALAYNFAAVHYFGEFARLNDVHV